VRFYHHLLPVITLYGILFLETRSQNTEKLSVNQAATVLLNFLQQAKEDGELGHIAAYGNG
jgi:hypothetical protein